MSSCDCKFRFRDVLNVKDQASTQYGLRIMRIFIASDHSRLPYLREGIEGPASVRVMLLSASSFFLRFRLRYH